MIILIPLGGIGERFKKDGYTAPKALINIFGKPIIYYLLDNLTLTGVDFVYIPYHRDYIEYRFEDRLTKDFPNIKFKFLPLLHDTGGAAQTIQIALSKLNTPDTTDTPILCLDGDNFYTTDIIKMWNGENERVAFPSVVFTVKDTNENPIYSYVKINNNACIDDIIEKVKISDYACTGAYGFNSYKMLLENLNEMISLDIRQKGEFYTSTIIKMMINKGIIFTNKTLEKKNWLCLGTPLQVKQFYHNYPKISCIDSKQKMKKLRICFDLDNTLVTYPKVKGDYTTVEPIHNNINFLRYLKKLGHDIIIHTARNMKTCHGNIGKVNCNIGKITFDTLERFEVPYDEIYFGKPYADYYIDDLAVNCFDDMQKTMGFYNLLNDEIKPRSFNQVDMSNLEYIVKSSNDLSGEIYYYKHIPNEVKDMFPLFIDYDDNNKWYKIEKIYGSTISILYVNELLSRETFIHVLNSIKRLQDVSVDNNNHDFIYSNYSKKLEERYKSFDYSMYLNSKETYLMVNQKLKEYEENDMGRISVIHGDAVFTNILINDLGKIKFIDMRGKCGQLTIYGDWLYDWAKLYQSLLGYDKILLNKSISKEYEEMMMKTFEQYFLENFTKTDFENLKWITKSLLFSLIPLHSNDKCQQFYELIL